MLGLPSMRQQSSKRNTRTSMAVVLAALCALVVTSISSASAMAAGPVLLDIFGNPICADGSLNTGSPHRHGDGHVTDCCVLACAGMKVLADLPPEPQALTAPSFESVVAAISPSAPSVARQERTPANPRAPPAA
jgi:hypothetical protein